MTALLFFVVAIFYSAVGFGGGSSYIAILVLFDYPYQLIPIIALICNLIVVSGNVFHFSKRGHFSWPLFWPYAVSSIPMAYIGGKVLISKEHFLGLLGICLFLVALKLLLLDRIKPISQPPRKPNIPIGIFVGSVLGFLSGILGIGGGIFLSPILLLLRWGQPKQIATTAAFFIFLNSLSGLVGQISKQHENFHLSSLWILFLAVFMGGQIGSRMGSGTLVSQKFVKNLTAALILVVAIRLLWP